MLWRIISGFWFLKVVTVDTQTISVCQPATRDLDKCRAIGYIIKGCTVQEGTLSRRDEKRCDARFKFYVNHGCGPYKCSEDSVQRVKRGCISYAMIILEIKQSLLLLFINWFLC